MQQFSPDDRSTGVMTMVASFPDGGCIYTFLHVQLGILGRLHITPYGSNQILTRAEIAPGDPETPNWERKCQLLNDMVRRCLNALPGGEEMRPLPTIEEVRAQQQLFRRFVEADYHVAIFNLVTSLSEQEYVMLVTTVHHTVGIGDPLDTRGLRQRLEDVQWYWRDLQARRIVS